MTSNSVQISPKNQKLGVSTIGQQIRSVFSFHTQKEEDGAEATFCSDEEFEKLSRSPSSQIGLLRQVLKLLGVEEFNICKDVVKVTVDDKETVLVDLAICLDCLRLRHFRVEPASKLLQKFITFRGSQGWPTNFESFRTEPTLVRTLESGMHTVLPGTDLDGRRLVTMVCSQFDDKVASAKAFHYMATMIMHDCIALDKNTLDNGISLIVDFRGASLKVVSKFTVADMQRGVQMWLAFPLKIKRCYVVGAKLMVRTVIKIVLRSVSAAMRSKVVFVDSEDGMTQYVKDKHILPEEYGGLLPHAYRCSWMKQLLARNKLPLQCEFKSLDTTEKLDKVQEKTDESGTCEMYSPLDVATSLEKHINHVPAPGMA